MLTEDNYIERIHAFTKQDWEPLLALIPEIEKTEIFGEEVRPEQVEPGVFTFPNWKEGDVVSKFFEIVYSMPIIIKFKWSAWDEGRRMANDLNFDYDTIDIPTKCKLITAIVRNDRFCEGALISAFESGFILKILKAIKKQLDAQ
jgi:hypothetical protein